MLTYDKDNALARQSLSVLLSTGLFMLQDVPEKHVDIDELVELNGEKKVELENFMSGAKQRIPNRNMSLDEAYKVVRKELLSLYDMNDAV